MLRGYGRSFERGSFVVSSSLAALCLLVAPSAVAQVLVNADQEHQTIDGFGASSAFFSESIKAADAEFLFSQSTGIGLSLVRVRVNHQDNNTTDIDTAKKAHAWGARVWAAPWTPPPQWKTNGELAARIDGQEDAHLLPANYGDFAAYLADFAEWMEAEGVPLTAITPQNEPDWPAEWDGCLYTPSEMVTFIRDHLGPELEARGLDDVLVFAPDTAHLKNLPSFADALVADAAAMQYLDGISTHPYSQQGDVFDSSWSVPRDNNLLFWQTEISYEKFFETPTPATDTPDPGMKTALWMGKMMHDHLTKLQVNAWNYWNLTAVEDDYIDNPDRQNPAFIQDGVIFRRAYVMGNYSKFVRPGAVRIEAPADPAADVYVSAYKNDERVTIVAINDGTGASSQTFTLEGQLPYPIVDVVPWVTSDTLALEAQTALTMTDGSFSFELPAKSVTSLVVTLDAPIPEGTGGTSGIGGSGAASGAGGGGAASGAGGGGAASSSGGAPSASGGVVGAGGDGAIVGTGGAGAAGPVVPGSSSGCSCRTSGHGAGSTTSTWALTVLGLGAIFARRRQRSA